MSATSRSAAPPAFLQQFFGALLPPARREQVLGDLEERYRAATPSRALWQYLWDALLLTPAVFWRERRRWHISASAPPALRIGAGIDTVRRQVEDFQQETYCRLLFWGSAATLISVFLLVGLSLTHKPAARLFAAGFIALLMFTVYQHRKRGGGRAAPGDASLAELVAFHRRELARRREFLRTLWYWKILPMFLPTIVVALLKPAADTVGTLLCMAGVLSATALASRRHAREVQQRIDELDRDWRGAA